MFLSKVTEFLLVLLVENIPNSLRKLLLGWHKLVFRAKRYLDGNQDRATVFDLVNAGPDHRFCTAANLVSNCLGLGYGCGYKKFPLVAWKMAQLKIPADRSKDIVYGYRRDNPKTVGFWDSMQRAVEEAAHGDGLLQVQMPNNEIMWRFKVQQYIKNNLDGSQRYAYAGAKILGSHDPKNLQDIYGAKIVENITQRMARDLLAEAVLNLEAAGIPICFHAHDEVIVEVDEVDKADALVEARRIMQTTPEWATGLPIGASGGIFSRYTKD